LRSLYFSLVRSNLEYGIVVWQPYLTKDQLRINSSLNVSTLSSRRLNADIHFISSLLNGSIDAPDLLSSISFRIPVYPTRNHSLYY
ncbi:Uncharacterized protein FWK35_00015352, partial [Aphis craccivora]